GAEGVVYFRYRTVCFGKEQYWHGILNHDGEINRRYLEVKRTGEELKKIGEILVDAKCKSDVGLIFSYDSLWATLIENRYYAKSYHEQALNAYKGFWHHGVNVDVISPDHDFKNYRILLAPFLYLTNKNLIEKLKNYVENGGLLIATARTSVKDEFNRVYSNGLPGELKDLFGLRVTDYTSIPPEIEVKVSTQYGQTSVSGWLEELTVTSAQVLGVHEYEWLKGRPAITLNRYGRGYAVYIGCFLTQDASKLIADRIIEERLVKPPVELRGEPVELVSKEGRDYRLLFLINHDSKSKTVELDFGKVLEAKSLLRGLHVKGETVKVTLNSHDVEILYFED
ncbi:MAG: beta-galactosidase trimerization domain-containing protein, partial [Candidatus Bathyarchaeia archaeon]